MAVKPLNPTSGTVSGVTAVHIRHIYIDEARKVGGEGFNSFGEG